MAKDFRFPDVGEGIHEGKIVSWRVKKGDMVKADQILLEMETDKAIVELPSPSSGMIVSQNFKVGDTVKVGDIILSIGEPKEMISSAGSIESEAEESGASSAVKKEKDAAVHGLAVSQGAQAAYGPLATPSTRRIAREQGVDLAKVKGSGPGGRITENDVRSYMEMSKNAIPLYRSGEPGNERAIPVKSASQKTGQMPPAIIEGDTRIPLAGLRKTIADRMVFSKTHIPHACGMDFIDVTRLVALREKEKGLLHERGIKLTYLPFIIKACVVGLRRYPSFNAHFDETKNELIARSAVNIGLAVDTPDGLMVIVIKEADKKPISAIAKEIEDLAVSAKERRIKIEDIRGSTFTITNVGSVGAVFSTPIINPPEVAIMGVHRIKDMPWVVDGEIKVRKIMGVSMCFDHRVMDGAIATEFMNVVKEHLEDPDLMLVDMI